MNTEQLKTAEQIYEDNVGSNMELGYIRTPKENVIQAMEIFASQESNRAVEKDRESRWISVKDRLPEIEDADMKGNVLGWDKIQKETHKCNFQDIGQMKMRFTHWQSLPLPPKQLTP